MVERQVDIDALTLAYRRLVLWFGAQLVMNLASLTLHAFDPASIVGAILGLLFFLALLATVAALAYYGVRTAIALGSRGAWLWAVAMFVPCANVISLLALSSKATQACASRGVRVGLFGPKVETRDHDEQAG